MLDYPTLRTKDLGQEALSAKSAPSSVSDAKQDPPLSELECHQRVIQAGRMNSFASGQRGTIVGSTFRCSATISAGECLSQSDKFIS